MYFNRDKYSPNSKENLGTSDPDFWGLYGDEREKKQATQKLDDWWGKERENLPKNRLPTQGKLEKIFSSFDQTVRPKPSSLKSRGSNPVPMCDYMHVPQDTVYTLLGKHYEVDPQDIRDIWYDKKDEVGDDIDTGREDTQITD